MRRSRRLFLTICVLLMLPGLALAVPENAPAAKAPPADAAPNPALDPAEVVRTQLEALKADNDAGIAVVFRFASPQNRQATGPLERFTQMLRSSYPQLLGHRSSKLAPTVIEGSEAFQAVEVTARDGTTHRFVFILGRQTAVPFQDCWMTEGVMQPGEGMPQKPPRDI